MMLIFLMHRGGRTMQAKRVKYVCCQSDAGVLLDRQAIQDNDLPLLLVRT